MVTKMTIPASIPQYLRERFACDHPEDAEPATDTELDAIARRPEWAAWAKEIRTSLS